VYANIHSRNNTTGKWTSNCRNVNPNGVPHDYVIAHMWLNLSAAQGYGNAIINLHIIASRMIPEQIAEAQKLAREWKPKLER